MKAPLSLGRPHCRQQGLDSRQSGPGPDSKPGPLANHLRDETEESGTETITTLFREFYPQQERQHYRFEFNHQVEVIKRTHAQLHHNQFTNPSVR